MASDARSVVTLEQRSVLLIGAGGVGAPAALALAEAGISAMIVVDDDVVELTNLHRQILFDDDDLGRPKLEAFERAIQRRAPELTIETVHGRATPDTVVELVRRSAIVIDASDNFPTRFLVADACALAGVPVVHAAAIRTRATVLTAPRGGRPCYRCLFEDLPSGDAPDCASAGVVGPVCGVAGAIAADAAVRYLRGEADVLGRITTYDGLTDVLRSRTLRARPDCPLCGADRAITSIVFDRYASVTCEA